MNRTLRCISLTLCLLLPGACAGGGNRAGDALGADGPHASTRFSFAAPDGLEFDAVIEAPRTSERNGYGVLMIGGGFGNDLDWTSPGELAVEGNRMQVTISGESHADAPVISAALVDRGFVVMRWSTIARGDPLADSWPVLATPRSLAETLEHVRSALEAFRDAGGFEPDRVILLGHSLGAARACTIAADDMGVRGLILLAPAFFTRPERTPSSFQDAGLMFGEEVVRSRRLPCLALFGALDPSRSVDSAGAAELVGVPGFESLAVSILPELGHQLGASEEGLHGPMDPDAATALAAWAHARIAGPGSSLP